MGSLHRRKPNACIQPTPNTLINVCGNYINISAAVNIPLGLKDGTLKHTLKVLDANSYSNVILGRDFLSKFSVVEFDFLNNAVKLGDQWHNCVDLMINALWA